MVFLMVLGYAIRLAKGQYMKSFLYMTISAYTIIPKKYCSMTIKKKKFRRLGNSIKFISQNKYF